MSFSSHTRHIRSMNGSKPRDGRWKFPDAYEFLRPPEGVIHADWDRRRFARLKLAPIVVDQDIKLTFKDLILLDLARMDVRRRSERTRRKDSFELDVLTAGLTRRNRSAHARPPSPPEDRRGPSEDSAGRGDGADAGGR